MTKQQIYKLRNDINKIKTKSPNINIRVQIS